MRSIKWEKKLLKINLKNKKIAMEQDDFEQDDFMEFNDSFIPTGYDPTPNGQVWSDMYKETNKDLTFIDPEDKSEDPLELEMPAHSITLVSEELLNVDKNEEIIGGTEVLLRLNPERKKDAVIYYDRSEYHRPILWPEKEIGIFKNLSKENWPVVLEVHETVSILDRGFPGDIFYNQAAIKSFNFAPDGWRLPTVQDWFDFYLDHLEHKILNPTRSKYAPLYAWLEEKGNNLNGGYMKYSNSFTMVGETFYQSSGKADLFRQINQQRGDIFGSKRLYFPTSEVDDEGNMIIAYFETYDETDQKSQESTTIPGIYLNFINLPEARYRELFSKARLPELVECNNKRQLKHYEEIGQMSDSEFAKHRQLSEFSFSATLMNAIKIGDCDFWNSVNKGIDKYFQGNEDALPEIHKIKTLGEPVAFNVVFIKD